MQTQHFEANKRKSGAASAQGRSGAEITPNAVRKKQTFFGFRVGNLGFLVSSDVYCEVLDKMQVNPLPNVRPWFNGLLNLRGTLVPVFDLRTLLGEAPGDPKKRRLFAIGRGDDAVAVWIDSYPEILDGAAAQPLAQLPELPSVVRRCVAEGQLHKGQVWLDIRLDELFKMLGRHHYAPEETEL